MAKSSGGHPAAAVPASCLTGALPALIYSTLLLSIIFYKIYFQVLKRVLADAWESCLTGALPALIYPTLLLSNIELVYILMQVFSCAWEFFLTGALPPLIYPTLLLSTCFYKKYS